MITRSLEDKIKSKIGKGRTIVIYGARQVGKTTLLKQIFGSNDLPISNILWLNGDEEETQAAFSHASAATLGSLVQGYRTVIIDEAQRIENIGLKLKILHDNFGDQVQCIATGSSSFELANKINEPMTGRKWTFQLFAPNISELVGYQGPHREYADLSNRLLFGTYPAIITEQDSAKKLITDLTNDNLYRDIIQLGNIIKTDKLTTILQALALQVGSQVKYEELSQTVGLDAKTIDKYIALLEQSFIIFRLPSFARNARNELKHSRKIYFYDNGIRNALINDFRPLELRQDTGALFENYIISELKKKFFDDNLYFWRNKDQQEIDFIIECDGTLTAIEVKYNPNKAVKFPNSFLDTYHPANTTVINKDNYLDFFVS